MLVDFKIREEILRKAQYTPYTIHLGGLRCKKTSRHTSGGME